MGTPFVFDAGPLSYFARAGRLETLRAICGDSRCVATDAVLEELRRGSDAHPSLLDVLDAAGLEHVGIEGLHELAVFAEYAQVLRSSREGDVGEAATLAWAETREAIAIVDDQAAANAGRQRKVETHGTLWLVIRGLRGPGISANPMPYSWSARCWTRAHGFHSAAPTHRRMTSCGIRIGGVGGEGRAGRARWGALGE